MMEFNLPSNWVRTAISSIVEVNPKVDKSNLDDDMKVSFVPMPAVEVESGVIDVSNTRLFSDVKKGYTGFLEKDVLFAKITPCMENGKMAVVPVLKNGIGFGSTEFHVLRAHHCISPAYIYYYVSSKKIRYDAEHNMTGAVGQRRVPSSYISNKEIPLPPFNEQKRIVAKLEELFSELDNGIAALKTAREQLKVYRQAVLKHAFEGKLTAKWRENKKLQCKWEIAELGQCGKWNGGGTPSKSNSAYWENGSFLWVSPKDMKSRIIYDTQQKITELGIKNSSAKYIQGEAILFVIRSGILRRILPIAISTSPVTVNQDMQAITPDKHTIKFLYWYCEANERKIRSQCSKDGTTVESINVSALKRFPTPIPTLNEQIEIVNIIEEKISALENTEVIIETQINKIETLRQSILKQAFSGKLVPQDSSDEPASELLVKIKAEKAAQVASTANNKKQAKQGHLL